MSGNEDPGQSGVVLRCDERLAGIDWPDVDDFDVGAINAGDAVVLCGGFEERACAVLGRLVECGKKGITLVLVEYRPCNDDNKVDALRALAASAGVMLCECVYDRQLPAGGGEKVAELVAGAGTVYVDISGMSRLLIVQVIVALDEAGLRTTIVYGEAAAYAPTAQEFKDRLRSREQETTLDFLSSGVFEVAATPELGSVAMVGEAIRLVVFPSFEAVQMKNLLQELQPTYVDVIHGVPPAKENRWRLDAAKQLNMGVLRRQTGVTEHEASTLDYRETIEVLLEIYRRRSMFDRLLLAPTGSKMQAVAVGLVRAALTDIQIVYPTPQHLNTSVYTQGLRHIYQLRAPNIAESVRHSGQGLV